MLRLIMDFRLNDNLDWQRQDVGVGFEFYLCCLLTPELLCHLELVLCNVDVTHFCHHLSQICCLDTTLIVFFYWTCISKLNMGLPVVGITLFGLVFRSILNLDPCNWLPHDKKELYQASLDLCTGIISRQVYIIRQVAELLVSSSEGTRWKSV